MVQEYVKVEINGREYEGILVTGYRTEKRRKVVGEKEYRFENRELRVYVPRRFEGRKKFLVIPGWGEE